MLSAVNGSRAQPLQRSRKLHAGEARHQIQLTGRDRPERDRVPFPAPVDEREVMRNEPLGRGVDTRRCRRGSRSRSNDLERRHRRRRRPRSRSTRPARGEPLRSRSTRPAPPAWSGCTIVLKTRYTSANVPSTRVVAKSPIVTRISSRARLLAELRDHVGREVDPGDAHAATREGQGDPCPSRCANSSAASAAGELGQEIGDRLDLHPRRVRRRSARRPGPRTSPSRSPRQDPQEAHLAMPGLAYEEHVVDQELEAGLRHEPTARVRVPAREEHVDSQPVLDAVRARRRG